jgi:hypothetical protein
VAARAAPPGGAAGGGDDGPDPLTSVFAAELAKRAAAEGAKAEAAAAAAFDGAALLSLVQQKYGRSYDFSLVKVGGILQLCLFGNPLVSFRDLL